ncbi:Alpha/Beta hydrolase protein [Cerioporus squamosus]|nr:Alpha/Beta hydrolase protein [Cerioporus squamosus]
MDPEFAAALAEEAANTPAPSGPPTVKQMRAGFVEHVITPNKTYHEKRLPPPSSYIVQDKYVPGEGGDILVRCVTPLADGRDKTFPVLVYVHGGCGVVGSIELDDFHLRRLSVELQLVTVNIEYRLAPEHPFPAGIEDCYTALKWVAENASSLKGDPSQGFLVGGHSAGANFATVLAHMARKDPFFEGRQLTGQLLREPFVVHPESIPDNIKDEYKSMEANQSNPPLPRAVLLSLYQVYGAPPTDPRFAPLLYPSHAGLPPAYIHVMDLDPLRDDGIVYEKALRAAGVKTRIELYRGVSHGFHMNFPSITLAKKVREDLKEGLRWLLGQVN